MNVLSIYILKVLRKLYVKSFGDYTFNLSREMNPDKASDMICNLLASDSPCMIARFGSTELNCLLNYMSIHAKKHSIINYIEGQSPDWWWNKNIMNQMQQWSGFFPPTKEKLSQFCELMLQDIEQLDLLGSWIQKENLIKNNLSNVSKISLLSLEPYWAKNPWSRVLAGKKILVVHPFASLIERQYKENRTKLFNNPNVLPQFELQTIQAIQSLGGDSNGFRDWFEALHWMEDEIDKHNYDICLIGCGAYGFSLAAHVKRQGKKSIHLGGALQLLFGIRGKRWDAQYSANWGLKKGFYTDLYNKYWIYPSDKEKPKNYKNVENGCYW